MYYENVQLILKAQHFLMRLEASSSSVPVYLHPTVVAVNLMSLVYICSERIGHGACGWEDGTLALRVPGLLACKGPCDSHVAPTTAVGPLQVFT